MMSKTKDRIIEAASGLINLRGFNNTSVDDLLQASGVKKGSFYYHFKSKEDLGYAIIENHLRRFSDHVLGRAFSNQKNALIQLDDFLDIILELHRQRNCSGGCLMGNMAMEMSDIHEGFRKKFQEVFEDWRIRVAGVLHKAKLSGELSDQVEPTRVAQFLIAGVEGGILLSKVKKDIRVLENCFKELKRHIQMYVSHDLGSPD
jgi:TetR/AcrR family transcriptional repressor of nem operon